MTFGERNRFALRASGFLACLGIVWAIGGAGAQESGTRRETPLQRSRNPHWLEFRGKPILLVGDSITQGWMELGANFDQRAYLDGLARRGINTVLLWTYIGVVDQEADARIGYDAPEIWPWVQAEGRFDLTGFNAVYFDRLRKFVSYANDKDIVVVITVHDGWPKTRFAGHPFNVVNGGPLTDRRQFVELHDPAREMPADFDSGWSWRQKHQFFLERFCERLIEATGDLPNVAYEMFNEGEWYDQTGLRAFQIHFLQFFRRRTPRLLIVNDDHVAGANFRGEPEADVISRHKPRWDNLPAERVAPSFFRHYAAEFHALPARPIFLSEPVPEYAGEVSDTDIIRRLLWGAALGGASVVCQNDASWGIDPRTKLAARATEREKMLDLEGHLARFFNALGVNFVDLQPDDKLASTGICLANPGWEYVVYASAGERLTVDLTAAKDRTLAVRWYEPNTGQFTSATQVSGGRSAQDFSSPLRGDAVLHLKHRAEE
jgi:hypothetical protein